MAPFVCVLPWFIGNMDYLCTESYNGKQWGNMFDNLLPSLDDIFFKVNISIKTKMFNIKISGLLDSLHIFGNQLPKDLDNRFRLGTLGWKKSVTCIFRVQ